MPIKKKKKRYYHPSNSHLKKIGCSISVEKLCCCAQNKQVNTQSVNDASKITGSPTNISISVNICLPTCLESQVELHISSLAKTYQGLSWLIMRRRWCNPNCVHTCVCALFFQLATRSILGVFVIRGGYC